MSTPPLDQLMFGVARDEALRYLDIAWFSALKCQLFLARSYSLIVITTKLNTLFQQLITYSMAGAKTVHEENLLSRRKEALMARLERDVQKAYGLSESEAGAIQEKSDM